MSFCRQCGKEKRKEWTGKYDESTGEKQMREVCSDKPCQHDGHLWLIIDGGFFAFMWAAIWQRCYICERCGATSGQE